jgi:hypothetical protein
LRESPRELAAFSRSRKHRNSHIFRINRNRRYLAVSRCVLLFTGGLQVLRRIKGGSVNARQGSRTRGKTMAEELVLYFHDLA